MKTAYWKEEWKDFYPDFPDDYLLIKFVPSTLELSSTSMGIYSDAETWEPPSVKFNYKNR
jgi:hypothetical protein